MFKILEHQLYFLRKIKKYDTDLGPCAVCHCLFGRAQLWNYMLTKTTLSVSPLFGLHMKFFILEILKLKVGIFQR